MAQLDHLRILLVDDEPTVRTAVARLIEALGAEVATAVNTREALAHLEESSFDVAIVDVNLGREHGGDLVEIIHQRWPRLAVVVATASTDDRPAWMAPTDVFLPKPFAARQLAKALARAMVRVPVRAAHAAR